MIPSGLRHTPAGGRSDLKPRCPRVAHSDGLKATLQETAKNMKEEK